MAAASAARPGALDACAGGRASGASAGRAARARGDPLAVLPAAARRAGVRSAGRAAACPPPAAPWPCTPVAFHFVLDLVDAAGWQVRQDADGGLTVLLAAPGAAADPTRLQADVTTEVSAALVAAGATPAVRARVVEAISAGAAGKRPLVVAHRPSSSGAGHGR